MTAAPAEPIEIGKFFKNRKGDFVVVAIKQFENVVFVDARQFFTDSDGISRPTRKGLAVSLRHLPELNCVARQGADQGARARIDPR
jgi:hypothetical protein